MQATSRNDINPHSKSSRFWTINMIRLLSAFHPSWSFSWTHFLIQKLRSTWKIPSVNLSIFPTFRVPFRIGTHGSQTNIKSRNVQYTKCICWCRSNYGFAIKSNCIKYIYYIKYFWSLALSSEKISTFCGLTAVLLGSISILQSSFNKRPSHKDDFHITYITPTVVFKMQIGY